MRPPLLFLLRVALPCLLLGLHSSAYGTELIHLQTGFDLEAQSHSIIGNTYWLRTANGSIELPGEDVLAIDVLPDPLALEAPVTKTPLPDLPALIESVARSQGDTPEFSRLVRCVAQIESALNQYAMSPKGATGLMQLMPETARELGVSANNARDNVKGGAKYLKELLLKYHNDSVLALAAYNAGPAAVKRYGGVPPYAETRDYIQKVLKEYARIGNAGTSAK